MGLFVDEYGHYQGWLAALLCCSCAVDTDEHPVTWKDSRYIPQTAQSTPYIRPVPPHISRHYPSRDESFAESRATTSYSQDSQEHLPVLGPELGLFDFRSSSRLSRNSDTALNDKRLSKAASINGISTFRSWESGDSPRHSLVPLRLAPVVLRSPTLHDPLSSSAKHDRTDSTQELLPIEAPSPIAIPDASYRMSRESPYQRLQRQSTDYAVNRHSQLVSQQSREDFAATEVPLSTQSSSASLRRSIYDEGTSSLHSHPSGEFSSFSRIRRKNSSTLSLRLDEADPGNDRDAIELNTIIEEHKADSPPRPNSVTSENHVPAVAPSMQVHVRSETLNDIGSILSRPLILRDAKAFDELLGEPDDHEREARPAAQVAKLRSRSSSRVSGWLSNIRTPSTTSMAASASATENCVSRNITPLRTTRTFSRVSRSSSVTAMDSPSLTAASSPISKRHSRSLTADSRMTSPPSTIFVPDLIHDPDKITHRSRDSAIARTEKLCEDEGWSGMLSNHTPGDVGLAF